MNFSLFNHWQARFTYRQKFLFLALVYALAIPFGLYVTLHTLNYLIQSKGIQLVGSDYQRGLGALYDSLLRYQTLKSPSDDIKKSLNQNVQGALKRLREIEESAPLFPAKYGKGFSAPWVTDLNVFGWQKRWNRALNEGAGSPFLKSLIIDVKTALERSGEDLLLYNNDEPTVELLAKPLVRYLPTIELLTARLASSTPISHGDTLQMAAEQIRLEESREAVEKELREAIHAYEEKYPVRRNVAVLQIGLEKFLKPGTAVDHLWAQQQLRQNILQAIDFILMQDMHKIRMAKWGLVSLCVLSTLVIAAFAVFRGLSSHFGELASHIQDLASGSITAAHPLLCFCSKEKDDFGKAGRMLDELSAAIGKNIHDIQEFYKKTLASHNHLIFISRDAAEAMHQQEEAVSHLEMAIQAIALKARHLADGMVGSSSQIDGQAVEEGLKRLQASISALVEEASSMVNLVSGVEEHVIAMERLIAFINKVSERANLLSLNAAIETATVTQQKENFVSITEKIQRFATHTSRSTQEIRAIFEEMSANIAKVKVQSATCFQDIHSGAEQLAPVTIQLKKITQRGMEQQKQYEQFADSMQIQAQYAESLAQSLAELKAMSLANRQLVQTLQDSLENIEMTDRELKRLMKKWRSKA